MISLAVLAWQIFIFFTIAISGRFRGWIVAFWVVWTILQVFTFALSVVQFGTIFLAWWLFRKKAGRVDPEYAAHLDKMVAAHLEAQRSKQKESGSQGGYEEPKEPKSTGVLFVAGGGFMTYVFYRLMENEGISVFYLGVLVVCVLAVWWGLKILFD